MDAAIDAAIDSGSSCPTEYDWDRYVFGVGCSGIAKGICELEGSLGAGEVCVNPPSPAKNELVDPPGGMVEVGEGKTSVRRDGGSFLSGFQIPVPQGNEPPPG